jgi:uncharacterized protein DUF992
MIMNRSCLGFAMLALAALLVAPAAAQTRSPWLQVGMLNCRLNPSIGFIIAGHQSMECRFTPNQPEPPQAYEGAINTIGLDIGFTSGGALAWAVFARTFGSRQARSPANMSACPVTSTSASAAAPTSWSGVRAGPSRCSRSRSKARSG